METLEVMEAEKWSRLALEAVPFAMILVNRNGQIVMVNAQAERSFGFSRQELTGKAIEMLIPERFRVTHLQDCRALFASPDGSEGGVSRALYACHRDGTEFPVEIRLNHFVTPQETLVLYSITRIAERRRIEHDSQLLAAIIESTDDAVISNDLNGSILSWNKGAQQIFGYSAEEIIGRSILLLIPPEQIQEEFDILEHLQRSEQWDSFQTIRLGKDGGRIEISLTISPLCDTTGRITGFATLARDCTANKEAERLLLETQSRNAAILHNALDCIISIDHEGRILDFNPAAERVFGYRKEQVLNQILAEAIMPPYMRVAHTRGMNNYMLTGESRVLGRRIEVTGMRSDGTEFPLELAITVIPSDRQPVFTAYLRDVSERKRIDSELAEQHRFAMFGAEIGAALSRAESLKGMLQCCTDALVRQLDTSIARIWTISADNDVLELLANSGNPTHADDPNCQIPFGKQKIVLIAKERLPVFSNQILGHPYISDHEWVQREGIVAFAAFPLIVENRVVGVMAMFAHHALSKTFLEALASAADGISVGIQRKNSEATMYEAKVAAEDANRAKTIFLANVSHELRTPMTAIFGYTEILMEDLEGHPEKQYVKDLRKIKAASKLLLTLIDDILDLAKIEAGKTLVFAEDFEVSPFLDQFILTIEHLLVQNGNRLLVESHENLGRMYSDQTKINQILLNLVSNAAKFTERGCITIRNRRIVWEGKDRLELQVQDTGIGISSEHLIKIFEPFVQAQDSTTRQFGGTGLGLAITKSFCEMLGGQLQVESLLGVGSTFTVRIPTFYAAAHSVVSDDPSTGR